MTPPTDSDDGDDGYIGADSNVEHTEDHPRPIDEDAIERAAALTAAAQQEVAKMSSDCLCYPAEELDDAYQLLADAWTDLTDVAIRDTDLTSVHHPTTDDVEWFMGIVKQRDEDSDFDADAYYDDTKDNDN